MDGIGERAGNASLEELVVAIAVREQHFKVTTGIRLPQFIRLAVCLRKLPAGRRAE